MDLIERFKRAQEEHGPLVFTLCKDDGRPWPQGWATATGVVWNDRFSPGTPAVVFACRSRYTNKRFDASLIRVRGKCASLRVPIEPSRTVSNGDELHVTVLGAVLMFKEA